MSKSGADFSERLLRSASLDQPPPNGAERLAAHLASIHAPAPDHAAVPRSQSWWKIGAPIVVGGGLLVAFGVFDGSSSPPSAKPLQGALPQTPPIAALPPAPAPTAGPVENETSALHVRELPTVVSVPAAAPTGAARPNARASHAIVAPAAPATPTDRPSDLGDAPAPNETDATRKSDLNAEVAALDAVRDALRVGEPLYAIDLLDRYEARFPRGLLRPEATILRIEAHAARGEVGVARRLGEAFLDAHPGDSRTPRIRRILERL